MVVLVPVLFAVIGALAYALAVNPKLAEMGRLSFFAGLFVALLAWAQHGVRVLPGG